MTTAPSFRKRPPQILPLAAAFLLSFLSFVGLTQAATVNFPSLPGETPAVVPIGLSPTTNSIDPLGLDALVPPLPPGLTPGDDPSLDITPAVTLDPNDPQLPGRTPVPLPGPAPSPIAAAKPAPPAKQFPTFSPDSQASAPGDSAFEAVEAAARVGDALAGDKPQDRRRSIEETSGFGSGVFDNPFVRRASDRDVGLGPRRISERLEPPREDPAYRMMLRRLGVQAKLIEQVERVSTPRSEWVANTIAQVINERFGDNFTPQHTVRLILAALTRGAEPSSRIFRDIATLARKHRWAGEDVVKGTRILESYDSAMTGHEAGWVSAWGGFLDYLETLSVNRRAEDSRSLEQLLEQRYAAWLPSGLKESMRSMLRTHSRRVSEAEEIKRVAALPRQGGGMAFDQLLGAARAKGDITEEEAAQLLSAAYRDSNTGLYNRHYLDQHAAQLAAGYKSLIVFKLDDLKEINDAYDHETGDRFIRALARIIQTGIGPDALVVRRSPTGFAIFVKESPQQARLIAEALRSRVEEFLGAPAFLIDGYSASDVYVGGTINMGVAAIKSGDRTGYEQAYKQATRARRRAKADGGNRVAFLKGGKGFQLEPRHERSEKLEEPIKSVVQRLESLRNAPADELAAKPKAEAAAYSLIDTVSDTKLQDVLRANIYLNPLTRLPSRRWFFEHLPVLFGSNGYTHYVALDLDRFGRINDMIGERNADLLLQELGEVLAEVTADLDAVAVHLGGEEFVILAGRGVSAQDLAERARIAIGERLGAVAGRLGFVNKRTKKPLKITASFGIADIHSVDGPDQILALVAAMAESRLRRAKADGRNQVAAMSSAEREEVIADLTKLIRRDGISRAATDIVLERLGFTGPHAPPPPLLDTGGLAVQAGDPNGLIAKLFKLHEALEQARFQDAIDLLNLYLSPQFRESLRGSERGAYVAKAMEVFRYVERVLKASRFRVMLRGRDVVSSRELAAEAITAHMRGSLVGHEYSDTAKYQNMPAGAQALHSALDASGSFNPAVGPEAFVRFTLRSLTDPILMDRTTSFLEKLAKTLGLSISSSRMPGDEDGFLEGLRGKGEALLRLRVFGGHHYADLKATPHEHTIQTPDVYLRGAFFSDSLKHWVYMVQDPDAGTTDFYTWQELHQFVETFYWMSLPSEPLVIDGPLTK